jgi:type 1 fimbria pilin
MNKRIVLLSTLAMSLLISFAARAADTTELKVKGVIKPAACMPTFTGGSTVDYGTIPAKTLLPGQFTKLEQRSIPLTVTCDSSTRIGITATDNRATSRMSGVDDLPAAYNFGLGSVGGKNVGGYGIYFGTNVTVDGAAQPKNIYKANDNSATGWASRPGRDARIDNAAAWIMSLGDSAPATGRIWNFDMQLITYLNKPENLDLTGNVPLDGSATIEIKYL